MDTPSFERDIRPLFRDVDVDAMSFALDLRSYDDVMSHAEIVFDRLRDGSMPCDVAWPPDLIETFRAWIEGEKQP